MATITIFISEALHFALEFIICSPMNKLPLILVSERSLTAFLVKIFLPPLHTSIIDISAEEHRACPCLVRHYLRTFIQLTKNQPDAKDQKDGYYNFSILSCLHLFLVFQFILSTDYQIARLVRQSGTLSRANPMVLTRLARD